MNLKQQNKQQNADAKVKIIPLGGLEQIGMNITAIDAGNRSVHSGRDLFKTEH